MDTNAASLSPSSSGGSKRRLAQMREASEISYMMVSLIGDEP